MKVADILRVKGTALYTVTPNAPLADAVNLMAELDIGSVVVMEFGELAGMLTFREVINRLHANGGAIGDIATRGNGTLAADGHFRYRHHGSAPADAGAACALSAGEGRPHLGGCDPFTMWPRRCSKSKASRTRC